MSATDKATAIGTTAAQARQCQALLDVLRHDSNGIVIESREVELIELAHSLAQTIYSYFWESVSCTAPVPQDATHHSGKLMAATQSMRDAARSYALGNSGKEPQDISAHIGWLQVIAGESADDLVLGLEQTASQAQGSA